MRITGDSLSHGMNGLKKKLEVIIHVVEIHRDERLLKFAEDKDRVVQKWERLVHAASTEEGIMPNSVASGTVRNSVIPFSNLPKDGEESVGRVSLLDILVYVTRKHLRVGDDILREVRRQTHYSKVGESGFREYLFSKR